MADDNKTPEVVDVKAAVERATQSATDKMTERAKEVTAYAKQYPEIKEIERFLDLDRPMIELATEARKALEARTPAPPDAPTGIGLPSEEAKKWSYFRFLKSQAFAEDSGVQKECGFEIECSRALADKLDREPKGRFIPNEVSYDVSNLTDPKKRSATVGIDSAGGFLVQEGPQGQSFVELLRNAMWLEQIGVVVLPNLRGDLDVATQTGASTGYWIAEDGSATESAITFGNKTMTPHTVAAHGKMSRRTLKQTDPAIEGIYMADHASVLGNSLEVGALHGAGVGGEPQGLANTSGVGTSGATGNNGAALTYGKLVDGEGDIFIGNAAKAGMAILTNARVRREMRQALENASSSVVNWVWTNGTAGDPLIGQMLGYPAYVTENVSHTLTQGTSTSVCSAFFMGDWSQMWIGMWGNVDVNVDTSTYSSTGALKLVTMLDCDIAIRQAAAFTMSLDILTA